MAEAIELNFPSGKKNTDDINNIVEETVRELTKEVNGISALGYVHVAHDHVVRQWDTQHISEHLQGPLLVDLDELLTDDLGHVSHVGGRGQDRVMDQAEGLVESSEGVVKEG